MSHVQYKSRMKIIGVIPSRLNSTRLARKPLALIAGVPMVQRVYAGASPCARLDALIVATDSPEILAFCQAQGLAAEMTAPEHVSGTDRIREIADRHDADVFVNIQGDEPMVTGAHVDALVAPFFVDPHVEVSTLALPLPTERAEDPDTVKVVTRRDGRALYFSRAPIPFDRDKTGSAAYRKHLGFYAYRKEALRRFAELAPTPLEISEKLEQLRFLESGIDITVADAPSDTWSVDTAEDLARVEDYFRHRT